MSDAKIPAPNGWIILDKPRGLGSTQAVAAVKRNLRDGGYAKTKVGHGGTLDPLAQGVLPIAVGEATKLAGRMLDAGKTYEFTIQFGEETTTLDSEGDVAHRSDRRPPMAAVAAVLEHFVGEIEQIPPAFSALKVAGKRAYDRARAGEEIAMKARVVMVYSLAFLPVFDGEGDHARHGGGAASRPGEKDRSTGVAAPPPRQVGEEITSAFATTAGRPDPYDPGAPLELADTVTLVAHVGKGTYIRSLARDIARALGTVGHVTYLRRTKAGPFTQAQAISLDKLDTIGQGAPLRDVILPLEAGLDDIPALPLTSQQAEAVRQGRVLIGQPQPDGLYCATHDTVPVALVELTGGTTKVVRGFNLPDVAE